MEYEKAGDFLGLLMDNLGEIRSQPLSFYRMVIKQIVDALEYIHEHRLCHRDIKPENVVVASDGTLKLIDFGFCASLDHHNNQVLGTKSYMAPEIIQNSFSAYKPTYEGDKADIFSLGVTIFALVVQSMPFMTASSKDPLFKLLKERNYEKFWKFYRPNLNLIV